MTTVNEINLEPTNDNPLHWFLSSGSILFKNPNDEPGSISLNAIVTSDSDLINVPVLSKIQRSLQMNFFQRVGEDSGITVIDVVIHNIDRLGIMTKDFFHQSTQNNVTVLNDNTNK